MNNQDRFNKAIEDKNYKAAAELAIEFGEGKSSKSGAWTWANDAVWAASQTGITLNPGNFSYPDFNAMRSQLEANIVPTVIVTRHAGLVKWLAQRGITGYVIGQANPDDVRGKHVIGALPMHLAALAFDVTVVDMPGLTAEQRGKDLTPDEMDAASASLAVYRVLRL